MSTHPTRGPRTRRPRIERIRGTGELLQAVPYLLGFHPESSLVLVGLDRGTHVVTARVDLADASGPAVDATLAAMATGGTLEVIAAAYAEGGSFECFGSDGETVERLERHCGGQGIELLDVIVVSAGRWRSLLCTGAGCCPADGEVLPTGTSSFAAAAALAGRVALPDRRALAASLDPLPADQRDALAGLVECAYADLAAVEVHAGAAPRPDRAAVRRLFAAARASSKPGWSGVDDAEAAQLGAALAVIGVRDAVWMGVDDSRIDGRALWQRLGRVLPAPWDAAPLFLFGWASWRAGEGALASIAAERAVQSDPGYSAADLLLAVLDRGLDPRQLPRLKLPRSA